MRIEDRIVTASVNCLTGKRTLAEQTAATGHNGLLGKK